MATVYAWTVWDAYSDRMLGHFRCQEDAESFVDQQYAELQGDLTPLELHVLEPGE